MARKGLFLILILALLFVPILQTAHALTHFAHTDSISASSIHNIQDEIDNDIDNDRVCLECLALVSFCAIISLLLFFFIARKIRRLTFLKCCFILGNSPLPYLTRAPPLA